MLKLATEKEEKEQNTLRSGTRNKAGLFYQSDTILN